MDIIQNATIKDILNSINKKGDNTQIHMKSGKDFTGKIQSVGLNFVVLEESGKKSFFDAIININDISAIEIQSRE
jgi:sRNA-binding regulator protein Hfq